MDIHVINNQDSLLISPHQVQLLVEQVLRNENCKCDEVCINFVDEPTICDLHLKYFNDGEVTDCITFPIDEEEDSCYRVLGEVFVCPNTALKYATEHHEDPYVELTLYIVHGLLHLLGYDDIDEVDRSYMREAEERNMKNLVELDLDIKKLL